MLALIHHHSFLNETARPALAKCESYASDLSVPGSACRYLHNIRTGEDPRPRVWRERFSTADLPDSRSPRGCAFKFNPRLRYSTSSVHRTFVNRWDSPLSAFVYGLPSSDPHGSDLLVDVWASRIWEVSGLGTNGEAPISWEPWVVGHRRTVLW